jgi:hypothetical protein
MPLHAVLHALSHLHRNIVYRPQHVQALPTLLPEFPEPFSVVAYSW